jgi:ankyrin repeat protein
MWASRSGYPEVVRILTEKGADVAQTDAAGKSALDYATEKDQTEVLKAAGATN